MFSGLLRVGDILVLTAVLAIMGYAAFRVVVGVLQEPSFLWILIGIPICTLGLLWGLSELGLFIQQRVLWQIDEWTGFWFRRTWARVKGSIAAYLCPTVVIKQGS